MEIASVIFLTSGLFLGWSLGANDAANVFGTAVGTRMVRFRTAAAVCALFVVMGATLSGGGTTATLGRLGAIETLPGAFGTALAAAVAVYLMNRSHIPVSTTQAIIGAIIGWNLYGGRSTDGSTVLTIAGSWVACPLLTATIAMVLYKAAIASVRITRIHLLRQDAYTRAALLATGAFGAYALGANNIANIMGVFILPNPFTAFTVPGGWRVGATEQLFILGGVAIAIGVVTYSRHLMLTIGTELLPLSPIGGWVAVTAHSIVLFGFASQGLERFLAGNGLPTLPLVPVSSSQAIVGAVIGIGLIKGGRAVRWIIVGRIVAGWITTPLVACGLCLVVLFLLQQVFDQPVLLASDVVGHAH